MIANSFPLANPRQPLIVLRLVSLLLLFLLELESIEVTLRWYFDGSNIRDSFWAPVIGYQRYIFSFAFVFLAAFVVVSWSRLGSYISSLLQLSMNYAWKRYVILQLGAFSGFGLMTYLLSVSHLDSAVWILLAFAAWLVLLILAGFLALLTLAPLHYWTVLVGREKLALSLGGVVSVTAIVLTKTLLQSWESLAEPTMQGSATLLRLLYNDVIFEPVTRALGTTDFRVTVTSECAGYEGIGLIVAFLLLYLVLFRKDLRFPQVLLLFPIGIGVIWTLNVLRIALLITIGTSISPDIALMGFHSNAGWIAFILVSIGLVILAHKIPYFNATVGKYEQAQSGEIAASARAARALLVPMLVLIASILLTSAFSAGFNWLYPLGVIAVAVTLWHFWPVYGFRADSLRLQPILIGIVVFLIWIVLVPVSAEETTGFATKLFSASPQVVFLWLAFRFVGSTITVPLAEELAFRGYLLDRLSGRAPDTRGVLPFTWLAFLASSILFGLFHGAWLAGTVAGMFYALARYQRGKAVDAVLAHLTTNLLLSLYILLTGEWSLW